MNTGRLVNRPAVLITKKFGLNQLSMRKRNGPWLARRCLFLQTHFSQADIRDQTALFSNMNILSNRQGMGAVRTPAQRSAAAWQRHRIAGWRWTYPLDGKLGHYDRVMFGPSSIRLVLRPRVRRDAVRVHPQGDDHALLRRIQCDTYMINRIVTPGGRDRGGHQRDWCKKGLQASVPDRIGCRTCHGMLFDRAKARRIFGAFVSVKVHRA